MLRPLFALTVFLVPTLAAAVEIDSVLLSENRLKAAAPAALRLAETAAVPPLAALRAAAEGAGDQVEALAAWNRSGAVPLQNGFSRPLPLAKAVRFTSALLKSTPARLAGGALLGPPAGGLVWAAAVRVEGAYRLRLHLGGVHLPVGTRIWVYGEGSGEEVSVAAEDVTYRGEIWTPSVAGPVLGLEVRLPEAGLDGAGFVVDGVAQTFELAADGSPRLAPRAAAPEDDAGCVRDAACFGAETLPTMELTRRAMALVFFMKDGHSYACSAGLLNDTDDSTTIPYLLTAHHCFESQASASSVEAFFDYVDGECDGAPPVLGSGPRVNGATLLATGAQSDFTLVRLSDLPPGRGLLGSTSDPVDPAMVLHRLSFPLIQPMRYSRATVDTRTRGCSDVPRPDFLYTNVEIGGTLAGSSGAPLVRGSDGRVVGQLFGGCGPTPTDGCDRSNDDVDGALLTSWSWIGRWLAISGAFPAACNPDDGTLCLNGGRFQVRATFRTPDGQSGPAHAVKLTDETGYLWFFSATNVEAVVKVLDACGYNQRFWVFAGGLTDVQVALTVTDTFTGTAKTYDNPQGTAFQPIQDTAAFATCNH